MSPAPVTANVVLDLFFKGGPIMWPILFCSLAAVTVIVERALFWWQLSRRSGPQTLQPTFDAIAKGNFANAEDLSSDATNPFLATINEGLAHAHTSLLGAMQIRATDEIQHAEKRLWVLSTFITLAPLLGLLGTVTGIMHSFNFVGDAELSAQQVSGGIAEALIATAIGLGVAVPAVWAFNYFTGKVDGFIIEMDNSASELIDYFLKNRTRQLNS